MISGGSAWCSRVTRRAASTLCSRPWCAANPANPAGRSTVFVPRWPRRASSSPRHLARHRGAGGSGGPCCGLQLAWEPAALAGGLLAWRLRHHASGGVGSPLAQVVPRGGCVRACAAGRARRCMPARSHDAGLGGPCQRSARGAPSRWWALVNVWARLHSWRALAAVGREAPAAPERPPQDACPHGTAARPRP